MSSENNNSSNGNGSERDDDGNIVSFPSREEAQKYHEEKNQPPKPPREPMFNLPPTTQTLVGVLIGWYFLLELIGYYDPNLRYSAYEYLGFIPGAFTGATSFEFYHPLGLFFYVFLHGSWTHIIMNVVMLVAFGTGLERFVGGRRMVEIFLVCSLAGIVAHFIVYPFSLSPVIGASGGISGLFGAAMVILHRRGMLGGTGKNGIWPFVILWVVISVLFGLFGSEFAGGAEIAWVAHLGGFFAGILAARKLN